MIISGVHDGFVAAGRPLNGARFNRLHGRIFCDGARGEFDSRRLPVRDSRPDPWTGKNLKSSARTRARTLLRNHCGSRCPPCFLSTVKIRTADRLGDAIARARFCAAFRSLESVSLVFCSNLNFEILELFVGKSGWKKMEVLMWGSSEVSKRSSHFICILNIHNKIRGYVFTNFNSLRTLRILILIKKLALFCFKF